MTAFQPKYQLNAIFRANVHSILLIQHMQNQQNAAAHAKFDEMIGACADVRDLYVGLEKVA